MGVNNNKRCCMHLACDKETYDMITKNCIQEFLKHNPKFLGMKITQNMILRRISDHYLKSWG